jgi:uncharacterized damage-inducible protein DinB
MTTIPHDPVGALFIERSRFHLCVEYPAKIRHVLAALPEDTVWLRPAEGANSVGNLVLHLAGNLRQWIVSGIGGEPDRRNRNAEFSAREGLDRHGLQALLDEALAEVLRVLEDLTPDMLLESRAIQGRDTQVLSALYHAVEHASGHVGQLIYIVKSHDPEAIRFYEDAGGLARPTFLPPGNADMG